MNIVHIGRGTSPEGIEYIATQRHLGHDYFVPGDSTYEQTVRRIMDADEIHIFDMTWEFQLGLVYFYSVQALHHKLHWRILIFDDREAPYSAWFKRIVKDHEAAVEGRQQLVESVRIGETVFVPVLEPEGKEVFVPVKVKAESRRLDHYDTPDRLRPHISELETVTKIEMGEGGAKFKLACDDARGAVRTVQWRRIASG